MHLAKEYSLLFIFIFFPIYMLFSARVLTARRRQTSLRGGGLWLPLERWCISPASAGWLAPCYHSETRTWEREKRQAGRPAEFWWALTRRELRGKAEEGKWALRPHMRWLAAALCTLCHAIGIEMWQASSKEAQMHLLRFRDWVKVVLFCCCWIIMKAQRNERALMRLNVTQSVTSKKCYCFGH